MADKEKNQDQDSAQTPPKKPPGVKTADWVEGLISDAQKRGEFDNLSGKGKPIPGLDKPYDPDWWIKQKLNDENIDFSPEPIKLKRAAEQRIEELMKFNSQEALVNEIMGINQLIKQANSLPQPAGTVPMPLLDEETEISRWKATRGV